MLTQTGRFSLKGLKESKISEVQSYVSHKSNQ